jgi:hypothetical protein
MTETQVQIEPSTAPGLGDNVHPARARREDGKRADRAPRDFGDRPKRDRADRPQREPRPDVKRSGRDDARAARYQQREKERAILAADPVMAALGPSESSSKGPPPAHPSGLNRKQRRDAARTAGALAPITPEPATPKRAWTPDADARPQRRDRPQHADARHAERRTRDENRGEGFKPRGPKGAKPFKPRGDKPFGKPGGKFQGKGKPQGKRDWRS